MGAARAYRVPIYDDEDGQCAANSLRSGVESGQKGKHICVTARGTIQWTRLVVLIIRANPVCQPLSEYGSMVLGRGVMGTASAPDARLGDTFIIRAHVTYKKL